MTELYELCSVLKRLDFGLERPPQPEQVGKPSLQTGTGLSGTRGDVACHCALVW